MKEEQTKNQIKNHKIPFIIRKSRKAFLIEYGCGLFLFILLFLSYFNSIALKSEVKYFVLALAIFSIASAEVPRIITRYGIGEDKMVVIHGIIKQDKKNIYYHPLGFVPDINIKQSRMQRVLDCGTIYVSGSEGNTFEIKDIDSPHEIMKIIERQIRLNKHTTKEKL